MTNLPRLYVNNKFTRVVHPASVTITQNIVPLSTASISLPRGEELPARSYLELFTPYGSAGMFRVRSPHNAYGSETSTAELEHMIAEIGDYLVKDEINEMRGASGAVETVFSHYRGNRWRLGSYSALGNGEIALEVKYESVLNVLLSILEQKPDCMMAFDFSTVPWTLNIVKRGTSVVAEGRLARNVSSATVSYDDSELTTRVWYQTFSHDNEGNINNNWTYRDTDTINTYGIVEGKVNTSSDMTNSEINATVNEFIRTHKHPKTSVRIQASELSHITGERIDKFLVGDLMRLTLPDYNLTVELNITSIVWGDVYNNPDSISIQLGEEEDTVVTFLHNLDSKGSGSGSSTGRGGGGAAGKEAESWSVYKTLTDEYGKILKEAGIYLDAHGTLIYAQDTEKNIGSRFEVQAEKINSEIEERRASDNVLSSRITQTSNAITLEVNERKGADSNLSAQISVTAREIRQEVVDSENRSSARITIERNRINQMVSAVGSDGQVTAASICLAINEGGSSATINADKIYLLGQTIANQITADYISAKIASLSMLNVAAISSSGNITCSNGYIMSPNFYLGSAGNATNVANGIIALQVVQDGNNYKIQKMDFDDSGWIDVPGTFSRATSLSGSWGGNGTFTVSASPQGNRFSTTIVQGTASWSGDTATIPVEAYDSDNPGYQYPTGRNITVYAGSRYDAGWNACRTAMLNSAERLSYYTGTVTTKYDAPSVGATARQVIYPYSSNSTTLYTVPDRR